MMKFMKRGIRKKPVTTALGSKKERKDPQDPKSWVNNGIWNRPLPRCYSVAGAIPTRP